MLKVTPHPDYPPEDGRYVRGNVLQNLTTIDVGLIFNILEKLSIGQDQDAIRNEIADDLLRLLKSTRNACRTKLTN
jgi:hypothetical protein